MDLVAEKNYMFAHTYSLNEDQIFKLIDDQIKTLDLEDKSYNLKINVVKNKKEEKLGYSYIWIDNTKLYNALIGLNYDGSDRIKKIIKIEEDENFEFDPKKDDWSKSVDSQKVNFSSEVLKPLITFPNIKIKEEDKEKFRVCLDEINLILESSKIVPKIDFKNSLYARNIPQWLNENQIKNYFKVFEKDKREHFKNKTKFTYPIVKIKNSNVNIIFSNLYPNTASFVFNMSRKVIFKSNLNGIKKESLIIFNQNKKRDQNERFFE